VITEINKDIIIIPNTGGNVRIGFKMPSRMFVTMFSQI
jgi:hypothetical protein